ncbi:MAG: hypothetical protein WA688_05475 [Thermoplasmata archaeon]
MTDRPNAFAAGALFGLTDVSGGAPGSGAPGAGRYSSTFNGVLTAKAPHVPDIGTVLTPPVGRVVTVTKASIVVNAPVAAAWRQHTFFFTRFIRVVQGDATLFNPNLDFLCRVPLPPGRTGTFTGAGGVGRSPTPGGDWTSWTRPLQLNSGLEVIFGCDLAIGNSASLDLEWVDAGAGTSVVSFARYLGDGSERVWTIGPPPPGKKWYIHNAFLRDVVSTAAGVRAATSVRHSDGFLLCEISSFPPGDRVQSTGGYSTFQTGPALNPAGTKVVYADPQWLLAGDRIDVRLAGPPGDKFLYAFSFTEVPA